MATWLQFGLLSMFLSLANAQTFTNRMDLAIIMDGSGSIHDNVPPLWKPQIDLIERLINDLPISFDGVRVALLTFSDRANIQWDLDRYVDKISMIQHLKSLNFTGGRSNIYEALQTTRTQIFSGSTGDREDVRDVTIIFTDGRATLNVHLTETEAVDFRSSGIAAFTIGIGEFQRDSSLRYMNTKPSLLFTMSELGANRVTYDAFVTNIMRESGEVTSTPAPEDPCLSSPCMNNGQCYRENPHSWGYSCFCPSNYGGRLCQIDNPCSTLPCPLNTEKCRRSSSNDIGRYCYDIDSRILQ